MSRPIVSQPDILLFLYDGTQLYEHKYEAFRSWKDALRYISGEWALGVVYWAILEKSKFCRILLDRSNTDKKWEAGLRIFVDTQSLTTEQALCTTKLGTVILTNISNLIQPMT